MMPLDPTQTLALVDGQLLPMREATIPISDRGFLFGHSVFETFRTYQGRPHALDRHLRRMRASADAVGITMPGEASIRAQIEELLGAVQGERRVRVMLTSGDAEGGSLTSVATEGALATPRLVMIATPFSAHPAAHYERGVCVGLLEGGRFLAEAKSGSYLSSVMATEWARSRGAYEAIFQDGDRILEGATSNLFLVIDGALWTQGEDVLRGITKEITCELAEAEGIFVQQGEVRLRDLERADEAFLTSATREIMPISSTLGGTQFSVGPISQRLLQRYRETIPARLS